MACATLSSQIRLACRCRLACGPAGKSRTVPVAHRIVLAWSQPPEDNVYNKPEFKFDASGEVPDEQDMWDGEQWEVVGKAVALLIPVLLLGAAVVGGFAANTYNQGADSYLVSPSQERPAQIIKGADYGI